MKPVKADGSLTQNQLDDMSRRNITYQDKLDELMAEMNQNTIERVKNRKHEKITLRSRASFVIVGHGKDWQKQAIKLKGTTIPIISTDVCTTDLINMGIIPQYIVTLEESPKNVNEHLFDWELIKKHKIKIIGSIITRKWLEDKCNEEGVHFQRFRGYSQSMVGNVGHLGAVIAYSFLADRIILMGMNCYGDEEYPFLNWYSNWRMWINTLTKNLIINCTEGGILYFDKVLECDFNDLEIVEGHPQ